MNPGGGCIREGFIQGGAPSLPRICQHTVNRRSVRILLEYILVGFCNQFLFSFSAGIKDFSNWPTVPQVFFEGEFVGGCDILLDMHKNGELIEELKKLGIRSKLLDNPEQKA